MAKRLLILFAIAAFAVAELYAQTSQLRLHVLHSDTQAGGKLVLSIETKVTDISPSTLGSATIDLDYSDQFFTFVAMTGSDVNPSTDGYSFSTSPLSGPPVAGDGSGAYVRIAISGTNVGPAFGQGPGFDVGTEYVNLATLEFTITAEGAQASDLDLFVRTGSASIGYFEHQGNNPATGIIVEAAISEILNANDIALADDELAVDFEGEYLLDSPYPNPFATRSQFDLAIRNAQQVVIEVFDSLGRRVAKLHDGELTPGRRFRFELAGNRLASGLYHVRVRAESFTAVRSVILAR